MLWYFTLVSFFTGHKTSYFQTNLPVIQYQNFRFWNFSRQICYLISPGNYVYSITLSVSLNSISQKSCCNCKLFLKTSVDFVSRIQAGRVTSTSQFHFLKPLIFQRSNFWSVKMECTLGICFKDFAMIATDQTNARSILVMKDGNLFLRLGQDLV